MPIKRRYSLITIEGVKELIQSGQYFRCRYDLVGHPENGRPFYHCIYVDEDGRESILIGTRATVGGVEARKFNIWPGLFAHHFEFGDGTKLSFNKGYLVDTGDCQGLNEIED